jgi:hypothetical protein
LQSHGLTCLAAWFSHDYTLNLFPQGGRGSEYGPPLSREGMAIGSGYFWSSTMNPLDRQPSTDGGSLRQGTSRPHVDALESVFKYPSEAVPGLGLGILPSTAYWKLHAPSRIR